MDFTNINHLFIFSRAIMSYLVNKYGHEDPEKLHLYPSDPEHRAKVDRLLYFDIGSLYKNIVDYFVSIFFNNDLVFPQFFNATSK